MEGCGASNRTAEIQSELYRSLLRHTAAGEVNAPSDERTINSLPIGRAGANRWRIEANEETSPSLQIRFWRHGRKQNGGGSNIDA
jgi:hypothetical protein